MEIKTDYNLKIVITSKPLIWEDVDNVRYFKNPFTNKHYGYVGMSTEKRPNGVSKYTYTHYATGEQSTCSNFLQACDKAFRLWQAEVEAKIAELATLSIEIK